jgi:D-3-phosphoglycerate dehydrogenase
MEEQLNVLCNTTSYNYCDIPGTIRLIKNSRSKRLSETEVLDLIRKYNPVGIIAGIEPITERVLSSAKDLKVVSRCGIDLETIDQKAARKLGITVVKTHLAPDVPVAELTVAMILSLLRKLPELDGMVRTNRWERKVTGLLSGKMVGVIGCEVLGTRVSSILSAFGCGLMGYDPGVQAHGTCEMVSFDFLIRNSDIITLNMPLRPDNYHLIGKEQIGLMKNGVIIVNTSRPGLIDEDALAEGLKSGKVGGAALDVFEKEPYTGQLINFRENTVLTPHVGSFAGTYRFDLEKEAMDNLLEALRKQGVKF